MSHRAAQVRLPTLRIQHVLALALAHAGEHVSEAASEVDGKIFVVKFRWRSRARITRGCDGPGPPRLVFRLVRRSPGALVLNGYRWGRRADILLPAKGECPTRRLERECGRGFGHGRHGDVLEGHIVRRFPIVAPGRSRRRGCRGRTL